MYFFTFLSPPPFPNLDSRSSRPLDDALARCYFRQLMAHIHDVPTDDPALAVLGTHSLSSGSASHLIHVGASEHEVMAHGGWRSDAYMRYVNPTLPSPDPLTSESPSFHCNITRQY